MSALLPEDDVETVFERLRDAMPGRTKDAKGPKEQPDPFRSCISCMLSAQSLDRNTAKASKALFALAATAQHALSGGEPPDLIVGELTISGHQSLAVVVTGDDRTGEPVERFVEGLFGSV